MDDAILPRLTPLLIVALPLLIGLLDVGLYRFGGNDATISKVVLNAAGPRPLVALSTVYSFGLLVGHLFFPAYTAEPEPPTYEIVAWMFFVLAPTFYAMTIIGFGNGAARAHTHALLSGGQLPLAGLVLLAFTVGGLAGKFVLPQHLAPVIPAAP